MSWVDYKKQWQLFWKDKRKRRWFIFGFFVFLLVFGPIVFSGIVDKLVFEYPAVIAERTGTAFHVVAISVANTWFRWVDGINIFKVQRDLLDGTLPVVNLELSANDIEHFDSLSYLGQEIGKMPGSLNTWRDVELSFSGSKYAAKIKFHGDFKEHWIRNLRSYKVKMVSGAVLGMPRFDLILFEDRLLDGMIARLIASDLGLFDLRDNIVVLSLNGVVQGVYYMQETLGEGMLEYNKCSNCLLVETTDNFIEDHPRVGDGDLNGITDGPGHGTDFDLEIANQKVDGLEMLSQAALEATSELYAAVRAEDVSLVASYFDLDYISSFMALWLLNGNSHFIHGDNLRLVYGGSKGKFYPLPRVEGLGTLKLENGGVEHALNLDVPLFTVLSQDASLRYLRNVKLYEYVTGDNGLFEEIDGLVEKYLPYVLSYQTNGMSRRYFRYALEKNGNAVRDNFEILRKNLEYAKCYLNVFSDKTNVKIEVIPDSIAEIKFDSLVLELDEMYSGSVVMKYWDESGREFSKVGKVSGSSLDMAGFTEGLLMAAGLDSEIYPEKQSYWLEFEFEKEVSVGAVDAAMSNAVTGQDILEDDIYLQIADASDFHDYRGVSFQSFRTAYPNLNLVYKDGGVKLLRGNYILTSDVVVPKFKYFSIEPGTTISIAGGKSIVSYSPLLIEASWGQPVVVKAIGVEPFGTFAVMGSDGVSEKSVIKGLDLSGGNEKVINGVYFSGGLSVYNMDLELIDSKVHGNRADDGLNVKYSEVMVSGSSFYDNFADQFDCDFCTGVISDNKFKDMESGDANGDGLDFSGSKLLVAKNIFENFQDKGLSIGEETTVVVVGNSFVNNNRGIAIKDSSDAFVVGNSFVGNGVGMSAYQKKQIYLGGTGYVFDNLFDSEEKYVVDDLSKFYTINFVDGDYGRLSDYAEAGEWLKALELMEKYIIWLNETS